MDELTFKTFMENNKDAKEKTCLRFKQFRTLVQPNINELADDVKSTTSRISGIEKGDIFPDILTMFILDKLYGLSINWLLTGEGNMFIKKGPKTPENAFDNQTSLEEQRKEFIEAMKNPLFAEIIFQELEKLKSYLKDKIEEWKKRREDKKEAFNEPG